MSTVNVFTPTQEECDKIQSGTVDTIPRELKLRILNEIPEIVRISVDLRYCVALLRGDRYVGSQQAKGQDFHFVIVQPATQLWRFKISNMLGQLSEYKHEFALYVHFPDLAIERQNSEHVMIQYTLLDLMFICLASVKKKDIFSDEKRVCRVMLYCRPKIEPLGTEGEGHLSY